MRQTPTYYFRWLHYEAGEAICKTHPSGMRQGQLGVVLQQWWEDPAGDVGGEWRDIPIHSELNQ